MARAVLLGVGPEPGPRRPRWPRARRGCGGCRPAPRSCRPRRAGGRKSVGVSWVVMVPCGGAGGRGACSVAARPRGHPRDNRHPGVRLSPPTDGGCPMGRCLDAGMAGSAAADEAGEYSLPQYNRVLVAVDGARRRRASPCVMPSPARSTGAGASRSSRSSPTRRASSARAACPRTPWRRSPPRRRTRRCARPLPGCRKKSGHDAGAPRQSGRRDPRAAARGALRSGVDGRPRARARRQRAARLGLGRGDAPQPRAGHRRAPGARAAGRRDLTERGGEQDRGAEDEGPAATADDPHRRAAVDPGLVHGGVALAAGDQPAVDRERRPRRRRPARRRGCPRTAASPRPASIAPGIEQDDRVVDDLHGRDARACRRRARSASPPRARARRAAAAGWSARSRTRRRARPRGRSSPSSRARARSRSTIPATSPIAQPVRQCSVALIATAVSAAPPVGIS